MQPEQPLDQQHDPLVTIITPTYNHEKYICRCIESVLAQSYTQWEQIIIDDGSTDGTPQVIARYRDSRIKYVRQENVGIFRLAETYNRALSLARGELVAILEGDDFWPRDKLETLVPAFNDPEVVLAYGLTCQVTPSGEDTGRTVPFDLRRLSRSALFNDPLGSATCAMARIDVLTFTFPVSTIVRFSTLKGIGGFRTEPHLPFVDYPTFMELSLKGKFFFTPSIMGFWRRHSKSSTWSQDMETVYRHLRSYALRFMDEHPTQLQLSLSERHAIEQNWDSYRAIYAFGHGRIFLILKEWRAARKEFKTALGGKGFRHRLKAFLGYCASLLHRDLEGFARLMWGRQSDLREVFDLHAERTPSEERRG